MIFEIIVTARREGDVDPYWHYAHSAVFVATEDEKGNHERLFDEMAKRIDEAGVAIAEQAGTDRQWIMQSEDREDARDPD